MKKNRQGGFTLVEVMVVTVLFGLMLLMIFPMRQMMRRVLTHAERQEQAEMIGDAAWRYAAEKLETGAVEGGEISEITLDDFCMDGLHAELSVEEMDTYRIFFVVKVSDGEDILYERGGSVLTGDVQVRTKTGADAEKI